MAPELGNRNAEISASPPEMLSKNAATTTFTASDRVTSLKLGIKYVDRSYNLDLKKLECKDTEEKSRMPAELVQPLGMDASDDGWDDYCFVMVRNLPRSDQLYSNEEDRSITFEFVIKSPYLAKACKEVMGSRGCAISWNILPVTVRYICERCIQIVFSTEW